MASDPTGTIPSFRGADWQWEKSVMIADCDQVWEFGSLLITVGCGKWLSGWWGDDFARYPVQPDPKDECRRRKEDPPGYDICWDTRFQKCREDYGPGEDCRECCQQRYEAGQRCCDEKCRGWDNVSCNRSNGEQMIFCSSWCVGDGDVDPLRPAFLVPSLDAFLVQ